MILDVLSMFIMIYNPLHCQMVCIEAITRCGMAISYIIFNAHHRIHMNHDTHEDSCVPSDGGHEDKGGLQIQI